MTIAKENEEKKRYLNGYRDCKRREKQLTEQIAELRSQWVSSIANNDGMPKGNTHSDLSSYAARLDELTVRLEREKEAAVRQYKEIYDRIQQMRDGAEKEVLIRRYLLWWTWEQIAAEMNYSYRFVLKIHGKALGNFAIPKRGH